MKNQLVTIIIAMIIAVAFFGCGTKKVEKSVKSEQVYRVKSEGWLLQEEEQY